MEKRIIVSKNGPYLISGKIPLKKERIICDENDKALRWENVKKEYPDQEDYALCRCGGSCNKPYCDHTHLKIRFDGTEIAKQSYSRDFEKIEGPELDLLDCKALCAGAGFCSRLKGTQEFTRESNNPESKKLAIQQACDCPSGRLIAIDKKTNKAIEPQFEDSISITTVKGDQCRKVAGPLWVKGSIEIKSENGTTYDKRNRVTLCRCGKSKNKPFCDGTHIDIDFKDDS